MRAVLLLSVLGCSQGVRTSKVQPGQPGQIAGLYTFGAPPSSNPALRNAKDPEGCFAGVRFVAEDDLSVDPVPLTSPTGLHPVMKYATENVAKNTSTYFPCNPENSVLPMRGSKEEGTFGLHGAYWPFLRHMSSEFERDMVHIGFLMGNAHKLNLTDAGVAEYLDNIGWKLAGRAWAAGGDKGYGGPQYSVLAQNPATFDCVVTFQATDTDADWKQNALAWKASFCGLAHNFWKSIGVHMGFRNHLRRMVRSDEWQTKIRAKLPHCRNVYASGLSLGGATASLFSACIQHAPDEAKVAEGERDFESMSWTPTGTPKELDFLSAEH